MYICLCKAVTDRQLESAINEGLCTRRQLLECFGVGGDCGKCNRDISEMLRCNQAVASLPASNQKEFYQHQRSK